MLENVSKRRSKKNFAKKHYSVSMLLLTVTAKPAESQPKKLYKLPKASDNINLQCTIWIN